jgi:GNAT superfamily N-acetyltransferase
MPVDEEVVIRACGPRDERTLSLVAQATLLETYAGIIDGADLISYVSDEQTVADFAQLGSDRVRAWLAETIAGKCPVGYALAISDNGPKMFSSFELKRLYLFYRFHGRGVGKRLMEEVLSFAKQQNSENIWLQVHEANHHAIEFYKHWGFVQRGVDVFPAGKGSYRVLRLDRSTG